METIQCSCHILFFFLLFALITEINNFQVIKKASEYRKFGFAGFRGKDQSDNSMHFL